MQLTVVPSRLSHSARPDKR